MKSLILTTIAALLIGLSSCNREKDTESVTYRFDSELTFDNEGEVSGTTMAFGSNPGSEIDVKVIIDEDRIVFRDHTNGTRVLEIVDTYWSKGGKFILVTDPNHPNRKSLIVAIGNESVSLYLELLDGYIQNQTLSHSYNTYESPICSEVYKIFAPK